jgi:hypothetical protein
MFDMLFQPPRPNGAVAPPGNNNKGSGPPPPMPPTKSPKQGGE